MVFECWIHRGAAVFLQLAHWDDDMVDWRWWGDDKWTIIRQSFRVPRFSQSILSPVPPLGVYEDCPSHDHRSQKHPHSHGFLPEKRAFLYKKKPAFFKRKYSPHLKQQCWYFLLYIIMQTINTPSKQVTFLDIADSCCWKIHPYFLNNMRTCNVDPFLSHILYAYASVFTFQVVVLGCCPCGVHVRLAWRG